MQSAKSRPTKNSWGQNQLSKTKIIHCKQSEKQKIRRLEVLKIFKNLVTLRQNASTLFSFLMQTVKNTKGNCEHLNTDWIF